MRIKSTFLLSVLCLLFLSFQKGKAQDAYFSQFYAASLYLNPAMAGKEQEFTFNSNFRSQWATVTIPYTTTQLSVILPFKQGKYNKVHKGGFGLSAYNDRAGSGSLQTIGFNGSFAYNIMGSSKMNLISLGVQGGIIQRSLDPTELQWGSQYSDFIGGYDPNAAINESNINNNMILPDVNLGGVYFYNPESNWLRSNFTAHIGAALYHINSPDESFFEGTESNLPMLIKAHGGVTYHASDRLNVSPNFLILSQDLLTQVNFGGYINYAAFMGPRGPSGLFTDTDLIFGTWYRLQDAFIFMAGIENKNLTIGFSYDLNANSLGRNAGSGAGAYEVSLQIRNSKDTRRRKFDTPRI